MLNLLCKDILRISREVTEALYPALRILKKHL